MRITLESIGEILQHIYDSELHLEIGWCWDGGLSYRFDNPYPLEGVKSPYEIRHTGEKNMEKAFQFIVDDALEILKGYPNSDFVKWWNAQK